MANITTLTEYRIHQRIRSLGDLYVKQENSTIESLQGTAVPKREENKFKRKT